MNKKEKITMCISLDPKLHGYIDERDKKIDELLNLRMMKEVWKDIIGYEGLYIVSNFGNIKSLPRDFFNGQHYCVTKERILKQSKSKAGNFTTVTLCKEGKQRSVVVRSVVFNTFSDKKEKYFINIDGNCFNNKITNIKALTKLEYRYRMREISMKEKKTSNYYALINDGSFSGKHPFVYKIFNKSQNAREFAKEYGYTRKDIIKLTTEEYNHIKSIDPIVEVLYFAEGKTVEDKFFF